MTDDKENKILSYFHCLAQARQYADTEGQELIKHELERTKERCRNLLEKLLNSKKGNSTVK